MITVRQHIPNFIDHDGLQINEILTLPELLDLDYVKKWQSHELFLRYTMAKDCYLMAEMKDGTFWVIATLTEYIPGLPIWDKEGCYKRKVEYEENH
jgi:hypothetical protein